MGNYQNILKKLNDFIAKFYMKMLLKGVLLFLTFGLIFFFGVLGIEYFLWLNSVGRFILFLAFVALELYLLWKYILIPILFLLRWKRGLNNKEASLLIGKYFPNVDDKLYNLLELAENESKSELLLASIQQRSKDLDTIPFVKAIDFKENIRYIKYLLVPFAIFCVVWVSGNITSYFSSYNRVINYDLAYEAPAPFQFKLVTSDLNVFDSSSFPLLVTTEGRIRPESMSIVVNGNKFLLQYVDGFYKYVFTPPLSNAPFYFEANGIKSREYALNVLETPSIVDFDMLLDYPDYTQKRDEVINSTGNALLPEGTEVKWRINASSTNELSFITKDTFELFSKEEDKFSFTKKIYWDLDYELATSNTHIKEYERLGYRFKVVKDAYPSVRVDQVLDSLNPNVSYYVGEASDDYEVKNIRLIYYAKGEKGRKVLVLARPNLNYDKFYYTFPSGLELEEGVPYDFYFEVEDNDAIHKGKVTKSQVFSTVILDDKQLKNRELGVQKALFNKLDNSLESGKVQERVLKEIAKEHRESNSLSFADQNKLKNFLREQEEQEGLMKEFSKQLKKNLEKSADNSKLKKLLEERLERQELEARKNEKLLEELNKLANKLDKEELAKGLEELGKKQKNSDRNLEQLLELTKRYYVQQRADQLGRELERLSEEQNALSEEKGEKEALKKEQEKLVGDFDKISKDLEELGKDNASLRKPTSFDVNKDKINQIKMDQKKSLEEIENTFKSPENSPSNEGAGDKSRSKQKAAAVKMKELADKLMQSGLASGGSSSEAEDAEMLRQLLDNLITFSFKQESLYNSLSQSGISGTVNSGRIRKQQELRDLFKHVDDSLFSLSLRQADLSEFVNEQISEVYYNVDKALESMAESEMYQGASYQKYVINASNSLSDFLANVLENMQQNLSMGSGKGEGGGFQLPDIIMGQEKLGEKLGEMGKRGNAEKAHGGSGKGDKPGDNGGEGQEGPGNNGNGGKGEMKGSGNGSDLGGGNGNQLGSGGSIPGPTEEELSEIYEIYKEQQKLRELLEDQLKTLINNDDRKLGEKLIRQMEDFQNDLLSNGITQENVNKMNNINRDMLKLENAAIKRGESRERESNRGIDAFQNPILTKPSILENYRSDVEILNRQALPLQQNFQNKVKEYFKSDD